MPRSTDAKRTLMAWLRSSPVNSTNTCRIMGARIRAQGAREAAQKAIRVTDRAEAEAWSPRWRVMADLRSRQPVGQCLNSGYAEFGSELPPLSDGFRLTAEEFDVVRTHRFIAFTCTFVQAVNI